MTAFLQTGEGDLDITRGRFSLVGGIEEKRQKIENRLGLALGEWFLDTREGAPWLQSILGSKNPDFQIIKRVLRSVIVSVPGIDDARINLEPLDANRQLTGTWVAIDSEGEEIEGGIGRPFVVQQAVAQ